MLTRRPLMVLTLVLALGLTGCFKAELLAKWEEQAAGFQQEGGVTLVLESRGVTFPCEVEVDEAGTAIGCGYFYGDDSFGVARRTLGPDAELVAQFVAVLQVPDDVTDVSASTTVDGETAPITITRTTSLPLDTQTAMDAAPGHELLILELDQALSDRIAQAAEDGVEKEEQLTLTRASADPFEITPLYALRVDLADRAYYPTMLPCIDDIADATSTLTLDPAGGDQNLIPTIAALLDEAADCDVRPADFDVEDRFQRIAGDTRVLTAVEVSKTTYPQPGTADEVVLARADVFPDALAGTSLAAQRGAPILLTAPDTLEGAVADEIQRVIPAGAPVTVLGGVNAISDEVVADIEALGHPVTRLGGANRFETATVIADAVLPLDGPAYLADGGTFQAALLSGAIAARTGGTVLLTAGEQMPDETQAWLDANPAVEVTAVGDPAIAAAPDADAIAGADAATLSVAVAREGWGSAPSEVFLASGLVFADGLTGGPLAAVANAGSIYVDGGPLLLVSPGALDPAIDAYLAEIAPTVIRAGVFGGSVAVADDVLVNASIALGG